MAQWRQSTVLPLPPFYRWRGPRKPRGRISIIFLEKGLANIFCKEQDSKKFQVRRHMVSAPTTRLCPSSWKSATDDAWMNRWCVHRNTGPTEGGGAVWSWSAVLTCRRATGMRQRGGQVHHVGENRTIVLRRKPTGCQAWNTPGKEAGLTPRPGRLGAHAPKHYTTPSFCLEPVQLRIHTHESWKILCTLHCLFQRRKILDEETKVWRVCDFVEVTGWVRSRDEICLLMPWHHGSCSCFSSDENSSSPGICAAVRSAAHPAPASFLLQDTLQCSRHSCSHSGLSVSQVTQPGSARAGMTTQVGSATHQPVPIASCTLHCSPGFEKGLQHSEETLKASVAINSNNTINSADTALRKELGSSRIITTLSTDCPKALNARAALNVVKNSFQSSFLLEIF